MKLFHRTPLVSFSVLSLAWVLSAATQSCRSCSEEPEQTQPSRPAIPQTTPVPQANNVGPVVQPPVAVAPIAVKRGCFAWSQSLQSALCVTGQWGMGREREWSVERFGPVQSPQSSSAFSTVIANDEDAPDSEDPLGAEQMQRTPMLSTIKPALAAEVQSGQYIAYDFHDQPIGELRGRSPDLNYRWQNATIRIHRDRVAAQGPNLAPRYTDQLSIQWDATSNWVTFATYEDEPVENASTRVASLPSGQLLIISERSWAEEGSFAKMINVQICDPSTRLCR